MPEEGTFLAMKKTIDRVYSGVTRYHEPKHFALPLPAEQQANADRCRTEREANLEEADAFGDLLWKPTTSEKAAGV